MTPVDPSTLRVGDEVEVRIRGEVTDISEGHDGRRNFGVGKHPFPLHESEGEWCLLERPEPPLEDGVYQNVRSKHLMVCPSRS